MGIIGIEFKNETRKSLWDQKQRFGHRRDHGLTDSSKPWFLSKAPGPNQPDTSETPPEGNEIAGTPFFPHQSCTSFDDRCPFRGTAFDKQILPGLPFRNLDDGQPIGFVPGRDIPTYPEPNVGDFFDYSRGFGTRFVYNFVRLPKEIRDMIYDLVVFPWAPNRQRPQFWNTCWNQVEVSRRLLKSRKLITPSESIAYLSPENRTFNEAVTRYNVRAGVVDFFKESEYRNLEAFLQTLVKFEANHPNHGLDTKADNPISILTDCVNWIWDNIVLDITAHIDAPTLMAKCGTFFENHPIHGVNKRFAPWPKSHLQHHLRVSHLTFEVDTTKAFAPVFDVTNYWAWNQQFANVIKTCDFISLHLPNLLTIRIFIRLLPEQARYLVEKEGDTPWINAISYLPVKQMFSHELLISNARFWNPADRKRSVHLSAMQLNELREEADQVLRQKLMPMSLREQVDENDYGLRRLFSKLSLKE